AQRLCPLYTSGEKLTLYCAVHPPSIDRAAPVMVAASSPQRNTAKEPICSGEVKRNIGCFSRTRFSFACSTGIPASCALASTCFCTKGVSTQPGQMALQVTPLFAVSMATTLLSPTRACLAATDPTFSPPPP